MALLEELLDLGLEPDEIADFFASLSPDRQEALKRSAVGPSGFWIYADDPRGFVNRGLAEATWTKEDEILDSVRDWPVTTVVACHSPGKTHTAARVVGWWGSVWPVGTALVVTTATTFRTVQKQLWPHVRRLRQRHGLPGRTNLTEWWVDEELIAFGFSAPDTDPEAVQGFHSLHTLVVVDEGGGISEAIGGALDSLMTDENARMLILGNPPTDEEGTWFQKKAESPLRFDAEGLYVGGSNTIRIPAEATPNFSGEETGICTACPPNVPEHRISTHLLSKRWVDEAIWTHGENSAYVVAKVHARFPEVVANRVIPIGWIEASADAEPEPGRRVDLGVDVASDGGDELAIARRVGLDVRLVHHSSGPHLHNEVDVSGIIWREIEEALDVRADVGGEKIRVKVDAIGVGWGVVSQLEKWVDEHDLKDAVEIVRVNVGERAGDPEKFVNQRAEMWWNGREVFREGEIRLTTPPPPDREFARAEAGKLDQRLLAQLSGPTYSTNSRGQTVVESKASVRTRNPNAGSPDRAEAILLVLYEPPKEKSKKKKARLIA